MHNNDLNNLQKELCDVPPVPGDAFSNIEHRIYKKSMKRKIIISLAASLLLIAGGLTITGVYNQQVKQTALTEDIIEELELARNFFNDEDSFQENDELALIVSENGN